MSVSRSGQRTDRGDAERAATPPANGNGSSRQTEEREVKAADPALSPETNRRLTEELREVVGGERVRVPTDRPHASQGERPPQPGLSLQRLSLALSVLVTLTFAAIIGLTTGAWWILGVAAGVHALGTTSVWLLAWRTTTITEHPSPTVAAAMTEEGVHSPDETFSRMVDEFREQPEPGLGDALAPEPNQRSVSAREDPARAGAEQAAALTPTAQPSEGVRYGGPTEFMIWSIAAALVIASLVIAPAAGGGWMWLLPAIVVPLVLGLVLVQWAMDRHPEAVHPRSSKPFLIIVAGMAITVGIFCGLISHFMHT